MHHPLSCLLKSVLVECARIRHVSMKLPLMLLLFFSLIMRSGAEFPLLYLKPLVLQQIHSPTCITGAADGSGRLFVCDQIGKIHIIQGGMLQPTPFLDLTTSGLNSKVYFFRTSPPQLPTSYSERGLLGLAFHPDYAKPGSPGHGRFYLNYTKAYQAGIDPPQHDGGSWTVDCVTVIAEFRVSSTHPDLADPSSERVLLKYPQPQANHNGGNLAFGPDGMLYIGSGDGGSSDDNNVGHTGGANTNPRPSHALGNGQDRTVYLGKILRIDPLGTNGPGGQYGIPPDNPFVSDASAGIKKEIYAYGIRNPWGLAFDHRPGGTGRLFCADVGQGRIEEVNLITSGGNYGWRYLEGSENPTFSSGAVTNPMPNPGGTLIAPIAQYAHPDISNTILPKLGLSVTGGYVYRGQDIPALRGKYVFGDYGSTSGAPSGILMGLEETQPNTFQLVPGIPLLGGNPVSMRILCLGEDERGELYVGTKLTGGVMETTDNLPNGGLYQLIAVPTKPLPIVLTATRDSTLFSERGTGGEELANGAGDLLTATSSAGGVRRALVRFDLSTVPMGMRYESAILRMHQLQAAVPTTNPQRNTLLYRLLQDWGEGTATGTVGIAAEEGDSTWTSRLYSIVTPQLWDAEGGDLVDQPSAALGIRGEPGAYAFQGQGMVADVHRWLDGSEVNYGWLMMSEEGALNSQRRFASREHAVIEQRPTLTLMPAPPYQTWRETHFPGMRVGEFLDPQGDPDGDGIANQIEYAYGQNPNVADKQALIPLMVDSLPGGGVELHLFFRRDTAAWDLDYRLEISQNLITWVTLANSRGGSSPTVENGATLERDVSLSGTLNEVKVGLILPSSTARHFARLVVNRRP